jgi:cyanophycinase
MTRTSLLLVGGAEDKIGSRDILAHFVHLAGGTDAHIAVIATASAIHDMVGQRYADLFRSLGAAHAEIVPLHNRQEAQRVEPLLQLDKASGIFMTGGDQLKLTAVLGGTPVIERLRQRHRAGCVIGGTSAGASAAAEHMLAYGSSGIPPRKAMMQFAPGLGLIGGMVIDQHFGARGRSGRLMTAVAHNPHLLGVGLDEDTAVEIANGERLTVLGSGSVMVVDGIEMSYTDIHLIAEHEPLTIFGMRVHVLSRGYSYDMAQRMPGLPADGVLSHDGEPGQTAQ